MPATRKSSTKSTRAAPRKKGGKSPATPAPPPDSDTGTPVDPAAVTALQDQITARDHALESQERCISELNAQIAALQAGGVGMNLPTANLPNSNMGQDLGEDDRNEDEETNDIAINAGVGLAPRTNSSVPSGFSRRTNQRATTTGTSIIATAPARIHVTGPAPALATVATVTLAPHTPPAGATASTLPATIPAAPVAPATPATPADPAPAAPVTPVAPATPVASVVAPIVPAGVKIRHPGGRVSHGCKLREAMGLTNNIDLYKEIHRKVLWMFTYANLPIDVYWKRQDPQRLLAISTAVVKAFPYLKRFEPPSWPVQEMIKIMLRNKRGYRRRTAPTTAGGLPINSSGGGSDEADAA